MCQSRLHGHHHHQHRRHTDQSHASVHRTTIEPSRLTRRQVLRGLKAIGLAAAASGLPLGSLVRAVADDGKGV